MNKVILSFLCMGIFASQANLMAMEQEKGKVHQSNAEIYRNAQNRRVHLLLVSTVAASVATGSFLLCAAEDCMLTDTRLKLSLGLSLLSAGCAYKALKGTFLGYKLGL